MSKRFESINTIILDEVLNYIIEDFDARDWNLAITASAEFGYQSKAFLDFPERLQHAVRLYWLLDRQRCLVGFSNIKKESMWQGLQIL
jgi:hypothetical protein